LNANLTLDRMAIEEAGPNPERLAEAIHKQLAITTAAIPAEAIAYALDISEIRYAPLQSFEGALLTTAERNRGAILINAGANPQRRRFTLAHELGHFLNPWHIPHIEAGFMCAQHEVQYGSVRGNVGKTRHDMQELEANRFAIELLAPRRVIERMSTDEPSLKDVLDIAVTLDLSKSSAGRRYAELHPAPLALAFTQHGRIIYTITSRDCPRIYLNKGDCLFTPQAIALDNILTSEIGIEVPNGSGRSTEIMVFAETLFQQNGYAMTLLNLKPDEDDGDDADDADDADE
jgi:Zn-dependent peptidase ImmA (M78 family)